MTPRQQLLRELLDWSQTQHQETGNGWYQQGHRQAHLRLQQHLQNLWEEETSTSFSLALKTLQQKAQALRTNLVPFCSDVTVAQALENLIQDLETWNRENQKGTA